MSLPIALLLHASARLSWTQFSVHPSTVVGIAALIGLYEWRAAVQRPAPSAQRLAFYTALAVLFFSLNGWIHDLSDSYLFSAHMVQHLLLALVVAPLLVLGTPGWMLRPTLQWAFVGPAARWLTRPTHAFAMFNLVVL